MQYCSLGFWQRDVLVFNVIGGSCLDVVNVFVVNVLTEIAVIDKMPCKKVDTSGSYQLFSIHSPIKQGSSLAGMHNCSGMSSKTNGGSNNNLEDKMPTSYAFNTP